MKKILITSALPYVNNIPHLGNLIQVLSADVFARYCRLTGHETLYVCGTDEYGTATETKALEEGITPKELCDRYYRIHADVYSWFQISFDHFGRTSTPKHTEITQHIFTKLDENGYISAKTIEQAYCEHCSRFLADRFVRGTCPHCGYTEARGDQCESCGKLLDPMELVEPRCGTCGTPPVVRESDHLYINLPKLLPLLTEWMDKAAREGHWARNAVKMTEAWIRDGLQERGITRDLKWGIPVPKDGYRNKVFYVWFDACIGYVSITANLIEDWESWWRKPEEVKLVQFIGKDNIPFHTVIFPCSQLGTGEAWTMLSSMSSTEYLNYESGKFSKSQGIGVFGTDAVESGIPADVWRFYIFYTRPEKSDAVFTWKDFQEKVNGELIGNLANLVNRTLSFVTRYFPEGLPAAVADPDFWETVRSREKEISACLEKVDLREAFRKLFLLSSFANKHLQDAEPWKLVKEDKEKTGALLRDLVYLVKDLAILVSPFLPQTAERIFSFLGLKPLSWDRLGGLEGVDGVKRPELLFKRLEDDEIEGYRRKFSGQLADRQEPTIRDRFRSQVDLRVATITAVDKHPKADKLYIETVDLGTETRQIVSGLVPHYQPEELLGRNIVLVANLEPAKLRGVESNGMLLAAQEAGTVEVLFVPEGRPGDRVLLEGDEPPADQAPETIDIERFLDMPISVSDFAVQVDGTALVCRGRALATEKVATGEVR
jgi:methionyl-tRNA synthetase